MGNRYKGKPFHTQLSGYFKASHHYLVPQNYLRYIEETYAVAISVDEFEHMQHGELQPNEWTAMAFADTLFLEGEARHDFLRAAKKAMDSKQPIHIPQEAVMNNVTPFPGNG